MNNKTRDYCHGALYSILFNLIAFGLFQVFAIMDIYPLYWLAPLIGYIASIPIYLIFFRRRERQFAYAALLVHFIIIALLYLIGCIWRDGKLSLIDSLYQQDDGVIVFIIFGYILEFFFRAFFGFVAPIIHLIICRMRRKNQ